MKNTCFGFRFNLTLFFSVDHYFCRIFCDKQLVIPTTESVKILGSGPPFSILFPRYALPLMLTSWVEHKPALAQNQLRFSKVVDHFSWFWTSRSIKNHVWCSKIARTFCFRWIKWFLFFNWFMSSSIFNIGRQIKSNWFLERVFCYSELESVILHKSLTVRTLHIPKENNRRVCFCMWVEISVTEVGHPQLRTKLRLWHFDRGCQSWVNHKSKSQRCCLTGCWELIWAITSSTWWKLKHNYSTIQHHS